MHCIKAFCLHSTCLPVSFIHSLEGTIVSKLESRKEVLSYAGVFFWFTLLCLQRLMHLCLQPKAQKQLQQLRLERMGPLDHPHAAQSATSDGFGNLTSTSASTASAQSNNDSLAQEDSLAALGTTERLPTKAELRGTLGTVNRKVHMATVVLHLYQ